MEGRRLGFAIWTILSRDYQAYQGVDGWRGGLPIGPNSVIGGSKPVVAVVMGS